MRLLKATLLALAALCALCAHAFEPFVVKDIRIEGIQRTEAGTIFSYLPVKVGETMTDEKAAQAIRSLYATGFFKDVSLEVDNGVLVVSVQERPSIAQIDIVGAKEFNKDDLLKGLRGIGLAESRIFDRGLLDKAEQELKRQYISRGHYSAEITTTATPLERNRVAVRFDIVEGSVAKIRQISIIGNTLFKEKDLVKLFKLTTPGLLTWFTKDDQYSKQKLSADLETLRSYYLDRGYLEFNVDSTQVSITPDKKDVYITIGITEGPQYTVSDVKLAGETLIPQAEALSMIKLKPGEVFSRAKLTESTKALSDRIGNDGYAFANVNAVPELDKEKRKVAFTFFVDPGRRVYVRRINVTGNTRTRDEVIRREMRQLEGGWYSADKIAKSKQRVDRLGYFTEVNVETPSVPGTTDQVDLNVNVAEKPTGNILIGAGYGTNGIMLSGGITQQNVFGSGNHLGVQVNTDKINTVYSLSFTQPYWTVDGVSRGFDAYHRHSNPSALGLGLYETTTNGLQARLGVPFTDIDTVSFGLGYENTSLTAFDGAPIQITNYVNTFGTDNTAVLGTIGWGRDTRDSAIYPTSGAITRANVETGLPGGTLRFYKSFAEHKRYFPLTNTFTFYASGTIGYGGGYDGKPLPFFRNFYLGGPTTLRAFYPGTVGAKNLDLSPTGGSREVLGTLEVLFPMPGMANDKSVRMSAFLDAGTVSGYDPGTGVGAPGTLRSSVGATVSYVSPFGPLKIIVGTPIKHDVSDKIQRFQFQFGQQF